MSFELRPEHLRTLRWRSIGPHRGGRVVAVAGDPQERQTFYFGACAGGVWKTTDGGTYWRNVSDGFFRTSAIGALAVADADPSVVYAGTGEACIRSNVSHGDGVYRSTDAGATWTNIGLEDTRHIARVRVDPRDPDRLYVAALGHAFGPNAQRGIFRSTDGGGSWDRVLFKSERAGAIDLSMDPNNPRILYAAMWQVLRTPWSLVGAGPESGLWRSTDGGDTWTDLTDRPGMPDGIKGRIGVAASPARSGRVWAIVEAEDGVLLLSDDGGDTWERVNDSSVVRQRPFYHQHIFAHPTRENTMWTLPVQALRSDDAGRSFTMMTTPHSDNHDLWIDPRDPQRMIEGNDGGACVSFDGGETWSTIYNQPTAQFYHAAVDTRRPYRGLRHPAGQQRYQHGRAARPRAQSHSRTATPSALLRAGTSPCAPTTPTSSTRALSAAPREAGAHSSGTTTPPASRGSSPCGRRCRTAWARGTCATDSSGPSPSSYRHTTPTCCTPQPTGSSAPPTRARPGSRSRRT